VPLNSEKVQDLSDACKEGLGPTKRTERKENHVAAHELICQSKQRAALIFSAESVKRVNPVQYPKTCTLTAIISTKKVH
jgi:hypothetical protein